MSCRTCIPWISNNKSKFDDNVRNNISFWGVIKLSERTCLASLSLMFSSLQTWTCLILLCNHTLTSLVMMMKMEGAKMTKVCRSHLFPDSCLVSWFSLIILMSFSFLPFWSTWCFLVSSLFFSFYFSLLRCSSGSSAEILHPVPFLQYFLPLFPVVTLSTSFPIIAITLTYNLKTLLMPPILQRLGISNQESFSLGSADSILTAGSTAASNARKRFWVERIFFPSLAVIPPVLLALATEDLQILVGIVGSYAGACIQYVIPALLIYYARKQEGNRIEELPLDEMKMKTALSSPFRHKYWIPFVLLWAGLSMVLVTIDHIIDNTGGHH